VLVLVIRLRVVMARIVIFAIKLQVVLYDFSGCARTY